MTKEKKIIKDFDISSFKMSGGMMGGGVNSSDVICIDDDGNEICATLGEWLLMNKTVPSAFTNLQVSATGLTQLTATYDSIEKEQVSAAKVEYSTDNVNWTVFSADGGGASSTVITGLTTQTSYYVRVSPINVMGTGASTTTAGATETWYVPTQVTGLTAGNNGSQQVQLDWSASSGNPTVSYTVERSTSSGTGFSALVTGLSALTYTDTTISESVTYYYRVKGVNTGGDGAYSSEVNITIYPNPVDSYGNAVKNEGGKLSGYNTYTFATVGTSSIVLNATASIKVLVLGGGGGGAGTQEGGGGAGGIAYTDEYNLGSGTYSVVVGGESGTSSFDGHSATGGSHGAANGGGSGNGTLRSGISGNTYGGYSGGSSQKNYGVYGGGGGAGATENGTNANGSPKGAGGDGLNVTGLTNVDKYYGGGGGGSGQAGAGTAGLGGGGAGAADNAQNGSNGTNGLGGGGGSGSSANTTGGSGVVIIRVSES